MFFLKDKIKTRYGYLYDCYIVIGVVNKQERERLAAREVGGQLIYVESTKEECIQRVDASCKSKLVCLN